MLFELTMMEVRRRMGKSRIDAALERQKNAEEDARIQREKAIARAKASGAFKRFGDAQD